MALPAATATPFHENSIREPETRKGEGQVALLRRLSLTANTTAISTRTKALNASRSPVVDKERQHQVDMRPWNTLAAHAW